MCKVKQCLLILLYSIATCHFATTDEVCDASEKPFNQTKETKPECKTKLNPRFTPLFWEDDVKPKENLLRQFNINYFDPDRIKSKDDFYAMDSDEIGIPIVDRPKPVFELENIPSGRRPQVLPDVVVTPEDPRRKLRPPPPLPQYLGDDEKQLGRYLVEDTRRVIHMLDQPVPTSSGYMYQHPAGVAYQYGTPNRYTYQPRPSPYGYSSPQVNYINKEFGRSAYQSPAPLLNPALVASSMYSPPIQQSVLQTFPTYQTRPISNLASIASPTGEDDWDSAANPANLDELAASIASSAKELDQKVDTTNFNPIDLPVPAPDATKGVDQTGDILKQLEDLLKDETPATPIVEDGITNLKPETSVVSPSEILKELEDLTKDIVPQQATAVIDTPEEPADRILTQIEGLLKDEAVQDQLNAVAVPETKPEKVPQSLGAGVASAKAYSDAMTQIEGLLKDEAVQDQLNPVAVPETKLEKVPQSLGAGVASEKAYSDAMTQIEGLLKDGAVQDQLGAVAVPETKPEKVPQSLGAGVASEKAYSDAMAQIEGLLKDEAVQDQLFAVAVPETKPEKVPQSLGAGIAEKDYSDIINAIMKTDSIDDLVKNPIITTAALKEIAQQLNIQQGKLDNLSPMFGQDADVALLTEKNTEKIPIDITKLDNYTDVLNTLIETDNVEDLINNPNIGKDVLKEIAEILDAGQADSLENGTLPPLAEVADAVGQVAEGIGKIQETAPNSDVGVTPIGIETEGGKVVPLPGNVISGCKKSRKRKSKTLRREDDDTGLYFTGTTNKLVRIPEVLMEKPLLSKLVTAEKILAAKVQNGAEALEQILKPIAT
ncbi:unnamed protein product [Acanthoscelides obtectus]|uniref:Uncharacterized protein n=1 Tax=Acanthoscelides obtectus TaxID=200917 RepID=A0A9P0K2P0_ACAOB|nr:unnamed protein product [Acanthoscelides obtectus]CAK1620231.1 hypothetical protein AOBTE_LOCUS252 [Acanthoscelides obtectus]